MYLHFRNILIKLFKTKKQTLKKEKKILIMDNKHQPDTKKAGKPKPPRKNLKEEGNLNHYLAF